MARSVLIAVLLACASASAQTRVGPTRLRGDLERFEPREGEEELRCEVTPIKPALNFSFRFQAGYVARVPMNQYFGPGHRWVVLTRITPEGGDHQPVYLASGIALPAIPKTKLELEIGGGYLVGEGGYDVKWLMYDDADRVCRKSWHVDAKLSRDDRAVKVAMPRDTIGDLSLRGLPRARRNTDDVAPLRLTVLLHAAPLSPRRTRLMARDQMLLLGLLSSLLERVPALSVRLVVFNLDQQKELFRRDVFTPAALDQAAQAMNGVELGLVDYRVLQNRRGHVDLLAGLVNQELRAKAPSDAVVFLGPTSRYADKMPQEALEKPGSSAPRFFYFQYKPSFRPSPNFPDSITYAVAKLRGKTMIIHSPGEFAKAIAQLERRAAAGN